MKRLASLMRPAEWIGWAGSLSLARVRSRIVESFSNHGLSSTGSIGMIFLPVVAARTSLKSMP